MDNSNKADVLQLSQNKSDAKKVQLILEELFPNENVDVPDPYYGGEQGFESVYQMLDKACNEIVKRL